MRTVCIILLATLLALQPAAAVIRVPKTPYGVAAAPASQQDAPLTESGASQTAVLHNSFHSRTNPDAQYRSFIEGLASFTCAILSLVCLAAISATSAAFFVIPAAAFGVMAVILGAIGLKRIRAGYAKAGFILGLLEIVGAIIALALI